jgi:hypothetical protein
MTARPAIAVLVVAALASRAHAQPAPAPRGPAPAPAPAAATDTGYVGREITPLEIDDCKPTELSPDEVTRQGGEHYDRGETLYRQGDYEGAVRELVYSYCLVPAFYTILEDIGRAYERNLDYEKAIGYLERYVRAVPPPGAPRCSVCPADPQRNKSTVARWVEVLKKLKAKIYVESQPPGAQITIANDAGVAARAHSGETIEVLGGHYDMVTELDGYEPYHQALDIRVGKPYTYFVPLVALHGRLSMQVLPPDARIFLGDRLVGIGHIDLALPANTYVVTSEAPDRITDRRRVEVLADQLKRVQVELTAQPQFGRRQLIAFSAIAGAGATGSMLYAFHNTGLSGLGVIGGGATGLVGSAFLLPDVPLGTSNLTVTSTAGGAILGAGASLLFTRRPEVIYPVVGLSAALGGTAGYLVGDAIRINVGDAALINSGVVWGSVAGGLFAASFDPGHAVGGGLVLSGLGMGTVGGLLLQSNFSISRTHAVLIDVGGVVGIIGGLALESLVYQNQTAQTASAPIDPRAQEHLANYALGGMAIGLLTAGILTRALDNPKIPVSPAITQATAGDGSVATVYGVAGRW